MICPFFAFQRVLRDRNLSRYNTNIKIHAFKILVLPHLEYCDTVWDPHTHNNINTLDAIQNKAARWAKRDYSHTTSVTLLKQDTKLDPLTTRHRQHMLYKITNNLVDINKDILQPYALPEAATTLNTTLSRQTLTY